MRELPFDSLAELVSQDVIGTDVTGTNAVRYVFGQCLPGSAMTHLAVTIGEVTWMEPPK